MTKLDKLFEKKLKHYQVSPSEKAWNKLDSKLAAQRRKATYYWIRVAAALLLPALLIGYLWFRSDDLSPNEQVITRNKNQVESLISREQADVLNQQDQLNQEKSHAEASNQLRELASGSNQKDGESIAQSVDQHEELEVEKTAMFSPADHAEMLVTQLDVELPDVEIQPAVIPDKKKVIVTYISGGRKANNDSPENEINSDSTQNPAFLAKVVEFAREDVALEKFVEAKDNILAFNFLKLKGQNSK